jgi:hyperosmotically inducible protein
VYFNVPFLFYLTVKFARLKRPGAKKNISHPTSDLWSYIMRNTNLMLKTALLSAFVLSLGTASSVFAESTGQYVDDATITTKVKAAVMADSLLKGSSISVETDQASVHLTGLVDSKAQESEAIRVANQTNGVKEVQDHLTIRGTQSQ